MPSLFRRVRGRLRVHPIILLVTVLLALAGGTWWLVRPRTLVDRLAALGVDRVIAPRLGLAVRYGECRVPGGDSLVPGATCAHARAIDGERVEKLVGEAMQLVAAEDDDALRMLGYVYLTGTSGNAPHPAEAISMFDSALLVTHDSAAVMTDLSAAYLVLAAESQSPDDLFAALDWADWALELEPDNLGALFNRALALEGLSADLSAKVAWERYLAADSSSRLQAFLARRKPDYRREVEQRLRALDDFAPPSLPADAASDSVWIAFAEKFPQRARKQAWETVLPDWGAAVMAGKDREGAALLHRAEVLGKALLRRRGGDAIVADQVRCIREAMERGDDIRPIAAAHRDERYATQLINNFAVPGADSLLTHLRAGSLTVPQRIWVSLRHASVLIDTEQWDKADQALDSADAVIGNVRYPSEAGYSRWLRGLRLSRDDSKYAEAIRVWKSADEFYRRSGEALSRAYVQGLIADAHQASGNGASASDWAQRASRSFRADGWTVGRHNAVRLAAMNAQSAGYYRAMRDLADEDVALTREMAVDAFIREAQLTRAALLAASGDTRLALERLAQASSGTVTQAGPREYITMYGAYVRAVAQLGPNPDSVRAIVEPLLRYQGSEYWRTRGLALRARAAATLGDVERAQQDLTDVFAELDESRTKVGGGLPRGGLKEDVQPALLRTVRLLAERGDTAGSLRLLERGTAALSPIRVEDAELPRVVPDGRVVIRPLLAGRVVLLWSQVGAQLTLTRVPVDSAKVESAIRRVGAGIPLGWNVDADLSLLYRVLVEPVQRRLGGVGNQVVLVTDANLSRIPFTALRDSAGVPLVRDHPVWNAVSMAAAAAPSDTTLPDSVAFFAPAFDAAQNPTLEPLTQAQREVETARRAYGSRVIDPGGNTPEAFVRALPRAEMVYFAGHAVADNLRPERSYLVLEPPDSGHTGHLAALALDTLRIGNVRLVVLSACSTLGGNSSARGGFTGLSAALLDAGARGVVGSLWNVPDSLTAVMMETFHRSYLARPDPARALWEAQRAMLKRRDAESRSPAVWAAFRYLRR